MAITTTRITRAPFVADPASLRRNTGRKIDWAVVPESTRQVAAVTQTVTMGASASGAATSLTVAALAAAIPSGTVLDFGTNKYARTTAAAAAGATTLAVAAIPTALSGSETATVTVTPASGPKMLKAGTAVGELLGAGKISPRVVTTNPAVGILESDAVENEMVSSLSGHAVLIGGHFFENLLPDATGGPPKTLAGAIKTELGALFTFETWGDTRAS